MNSRKFLLNQTFVNFYKCYLDINIDSRFNGGAQIISKAPEGHYKKAPKIKDLM